MSLSDVLVNPKYGRHKVNVPPVVGMDLDAPCSYPSVGQDKGDLLSVNEVVSSSDNPCIAKPENVDVPVEYFPLGECPNCSIVTNIESDGHLSSEKIGTMVGVCEMLDPNPHIRLANSHRDYAPTDFVPDLPHFPE